jgi:Enoyl-(Acyl carrier protein) reductase
MDTPGEDLVQRQYHSQDWKEKGMAQQPFGRLLDPNEVARCIAFCASAESGMMTGCVIDFDQSVIGAGPAYVSCILLLLLLSSTQLLQAHLALNASY